MERGKGHPFLAFIVLLLAMALSAYGGYRYYEYRNIEPKEETEENASVAKLSDTEVKDIYAKKIPIIETYGESPNTYQSTKKDISNMDLSYLRAFLYTKIEFKDGDIEPFPSDDATGFQVVGFDDLYADGWFIFDASLLQEQSKIYLGQEIENGEFAEHAGSGAQYVDGKYQHSMGGATSIISTHLREYVSYTQNEDTLKIKDNYLGYYYDTLTNTYTIYSSSEKTTPVATITLEDTMSDEQVKEYMKTTYGVYIKEYTHTFKLDENNNWYWVSTEPTE